MRKERENGIIIHEEGGVKIRLKSQLIIPAT